MVGKVNTGDCGGRQLRQAGGRANGWQADSPRRQTPQRELLRCRSEEKGEVLQGMASQEEEMGLALAWALMEIPR
jgi:hypothetical protein